MALSETLQEYIDAGACGFWVCSYEEERIIPEIKITTRKRKFLTWNSVDGLVEGDAVILSPDGGLVGALQALYEKQQSEKWSAVLLDTHESLNPKAKRLIRQIVQQQKGVLVLVGPSSEIPLELTKSLVVLPFELPTEDMLLKEVEGPARKVPSMSEDEKLILAESAKGLTLSETRVQLKRVLRTSRATINEAAAQIWAFKAKAWSQNGLVDVSRPTKTWSDFGGYPDLKKYFDDVMFCFSKEGRNLGLPPVKGVMLAGPPGCGKTLFSEVIASYIRWNFARVDLGQVFGPYVGMSEARMRDLISLLNALVPVVVQFDEMNLQTSGHESSGFTDAGVSARINQALLTWLEDRPFGTLVIGTTNQPWKMQTHILRSGRFNRMFDVGFPTQDMLDDILRIHLGKWGLEALIEQPEVRRLTVLFRDKKFTGAEVRQVVEDALRVAAPKKPGAKELVLMADQIVPIAKIMDKEIAKYEEWAKGRTTSVVTE